MDAPKGKHWQQIMSRAADFVFGGLMIVLGAGIISIPIFKGFKPDDGIVIAVGAVPLIYGVSLICRSRVKPPEQQPDASQQST